MIWEAFRIANNWRDLHAYPMQSVRGSVLTYMGRCGVEGITAARLKRMQAIRRKLRRISLNLNQLQDLGGCRVILPTFADVRSLVGILKDQIRHEVWAEDNYIEQPKTDGYRSHHLKLKFVGRGAAQIYNGRRIELQVRTRLQHSWATTVEAVGLFRREELKNHHGSDDWLRLFTLMSAEFAEVEHCQLPPGISDKFARREEIWRLEKTLDAVNVLESLSHGVRGTDIPLGAGYRPRDFLIRYDHASRVVYVEPQNQPLTATESYDDAEAADNRNDRATQNVVLVEVDKIENLKKAYPNYFGDVEQFKDTLRDITLGIGAREYTSPPKQPPPPRWPVQVVDPAWLRRSKLHGLSSKKRKKGRQ